MSAVSALTTALTDDGRPREPQGLSSIAENSIPSTISSSAFPCLSEGGPSGDAFEVELDLKKLTLGEKDDRWGKRRSLDRRSLDRRSLDRRSIGRRSLDRSSFDEPQDESQRWEKLGSPQLISKFMSPGSLGSAAGLFMPKPMSLEARRAAGLDALSPSPRVLRLKDCQPSQLSARSAEGRKLRRKVLRGSVLVCIVAGYHGKRFIYERAHELGVRMVIVDSEESWAKDLAEEGIVSKFIALDFSDESLVFEKCLDVIKQVEKELGCVDGVISFWELSQPLVARLAEQLGLPGNPPDAVDNARDKQRTRDVMKEKGLPTPKNMAVTSASHLDKASRVVGFPAVLKPSSGAASLGVIKVDSLEDLERVYQRVCKETASVSQTADGRLQTDMESEAPAGKGGGKAGWSQTFIMEQYLDGPEVDIDLVMSGGEAVYGGVTDNWPTVEPYFNETGSNSPSILPLEQQRALCELAVSSAKALGFQMGVLHVEAKFTSHGPHLIEINARMGGGPVRLMNQLVWGVDLVEEQLLASAGIPSRPYIAQQPSSHVAEYSVNAPRTGFMQHTDFLQEWQQNEEVVYCRPLVETGEKVTAIADGMPTWLYEVLVTKPTVEEAIDFVKDIEQRVASGLPIANAPLPT